MTGSCRLASLSISGVNPWYPLRLDIWQAGLPSVEPAGTLVNLPPTGTKANVQQPQPSAVQAPATQAPARTATPTFQTAAVQAPAAQKPPRLEDGTPVKLRISRTISSADAQVDDRVDFEVLEEVKVGDLLVIPKGGLAWATVTKAQPKRRMGRGGQLDINIDSVRLLTGEKAALRAVKETKGGGHVGAMTAGIVATSLVFFPAAPLFLLVHGHDITIPKGTELTAYINGDIEIDQSKFLAAAGVPSAPAPAAVQSPQAGVPSQQGSVQSPPPPSAQELSTITIKSSPEAAEILVDGKFVGNTPSTLRLPPGDHSISIEKAGFENWRRTMSVIPGSTVTIDAGLNKKN